MKPTDRHTVLQVSTTIAFVALLILPGCSGGGGATTPNGYPPSMTQGTIPINGGVSPQLPTPTALISQKTNLQNTQYVVFAWNDLGMHCLSPTYDQAVVLPPYNNIWVQVVKRGSPPVVVTQGLTVEYRILGNTYSYGKAAFGQFWDNIQKLFGVNVEKNKGLNLTNPSISNGLSGSLVNKNDHFEVDGIPLTPIWITEPGVLIKSPK